MTSSGASVGPFSFSRISTYDTCPRKFKYTYIDGLTQEKVNALALKKGSNIHELFEYYPDRPENPEGIEPEHFEIFQNFLKTEIGKELFLKNYENSLREFDFGLSETNGVLECRKYTDKDIFFRGSVDFLYFVDSRTLHLVDWKSGKYKEEIWQSYNQLIMYSLYFFTRYPELEDIRISYVYVEHDGLNELVLKRKYLEKYKEILLNKVHKIQNCTEFKKNVQVLCNWCEYKLHCESER